MLINELDAARMAFGARDTRELNPLQMAYIGDTVHDLYVRSLLMAKGATVGKMHKQATRMVSAAAQAKMLSAIEMELTEAEADILLRSPYAWGCDACQDVCPYTKAAIAAGTIETEIPYFRSRVLGRVTPAAIDAMTEEEYKSYAFGWRKKDVLIRNLTLREEKS